VVPCCQARSRASSRRRGRPIRRSRRCSRTAAPARARLDLTQRGPRPRPRAHGYKVTVTELVGWDTREDELILAKRVHRYSAAARAQLRTLLERFRIEPAIVRALAARGLDPRADRARSRRRSELGPSVDPRDEPA